MDGVLSDDLRYAAKCCLEASLAEIAAEHIAMLVHIAPGPASELASVSARTGNVKRLAPKEGTA